MKPSLTRLTLALLPLFGAASVSAATVTWVGPNGGVWNSVNNWQNLTLPTAQDDVQLGSFNTMITGQTFASSVAGTGTLFISTPDSSGLALSGNSSLGGLMLFGGSFANSTNTVISGSLTWHEGFLLGPGTTRVEGSTTLNLGSGMLALVAGHTLVLQGSTRVGTDSTSVFGLELTINNARLVNEGSWLEKANGNNSFTNSNPQLSLSNFDNVGTFTKTSATITTFENGVLFNNSGTVNVNAGTLRIAGGGNSSTGSFQVAEGATLAFGGSTTYTLGAAVSNAGNVTVDGNVSAAQGLQLAGKVAVNAGELSLGAASSFVDLSLNRFGAINSSATLLVTGDFDFTGGFLNGSGTTRSTGALRISGSDSKFLNLSNLVAAGSTRQTGTGRVAIGGRVENLGTWSEQATGNNLIDGIPGGSSSF